MKTRIYATPAVKGLSYYHNNRQLFLNKVLFINYRCYRAYTFWTKHYILSETNDRVACYVTISQVTLFADDRPLHDPYMYKHSHVYLSHE